MEENKKNYTSPTPETKNDELEIDWMDILRRIIAIRKTLYKAAGIGLVLGIIISFSIPKQYTVNVTLSPEMSDTKTSGGLASLASSFLGGGNMGGGADALNTSLSTDIVASTPFILELFNIPVQTLDGKIDTTLIAYLDTESLPWWNYILKAPNMAIGYIRNLFTEKTDTTSILNSFQLTTEQTAKVNKLKQTILTNVDKMTAITTISVTLQDPQVTALVADSIVAKLQQYIINYRITKAKEDCTYLELLYKERQQEYYDAQQRYARYVDANKSLILQSVRTEQERLQNDMNLAYQVYSQVAQQLQVARAKIQEEKPVFAVIEPSTIPLQPSGISKKIIILGIIVLTVIGTGIWILFGKSYWNNIKKELQQ